MIQHHPDTCLALSRQHNRELVEAAAARHLARSVRPSQRTLLAIAAAALRGLRPSARVHAKPVKPVAVTQF